MKFHPPGDMGDTDTQLIPVLQLPGRGLPRCGGLHLDLRNQFSRGFHFHVNQSGDWMHGWIPTCLGITSLHEVAEGAVSVLGANQSSDRINSVEHFTLSKLFFWVRGQTIYILYFYFFFFLGNNYMGRSERQEGIYRDCVSYGVCTKIDTEAKEKPVLGK